MSIRVNSPNIGLCIVLFLINHVSLKEVWRFLTLSGLGERIQWKSSSMTSNQRPGPEPLELSYLNICLAYLILRMVQKISPTNIIAESSAETIKKIVADLCGTSLRCSRIE